MALRSDGAGDPSPRAVVWPLEQSGLHPRIDVVLTDFIQTPIPCLREELTDSALYYCRFLDSGSFTVPDSLADVAQYTRVADEIPPDVEPGYPRGGGNYIVHTADGTIYEGCSYSWSTSAWSCGAEMTSERPWINNVTTNENAVILDAVETWGRDLQTTLYVLAQVAVCLATIYAIEQTGGGIWAYSLAAQEIVDNCATIST